MDVENVLATITDRAKEDGLDLKVEKGRPIPGKENKNYYLVKSEEAGFVDGKKCEDCGKPVKRICRLVYVDDDKPGKCSFRDICDSCYSEKYSAQQTLHRCANNCPNCTCKEKV